MSETPTYRWKTSDFAVGYDAAAEVVHPYYLDLQDEILRQFAGRPQPPALVVDLGGGSGRLMERILDAWPQATGVVVDFSEPFLALAERRLLRFGERARCVLARLQDDWPAQLLGPATAFVSMSAVHHLEPAEKQSLYARCYEQLASGGLLVNGDEVRAAADADYVAELSNWADHMRHGMASGAIPAVFHDALRGWIDRNVTRFGQEKKSGDDCHETITAQLGYLRSAGFEVADCPWQRGLWALLRGVKRAA